MGYRGLRRVCPTHANGSVPQPLPHATPEEIAFGHEAFLAMLDALKPDFMPVRGLTLFKQLWLSSENGITMLAPGLCPYVLRSRPDVRICYYPPSRRGISSHVSECRKGEAVRKRHIRCSPPGLIQAPAYIRVPPPGWGNICLFDVIKRDHLSFKLVTASFPLEE